MVLVLQKATYLIPAIISFTFTIHQPTFSDLFLFLLPSFITSSFIGGFCCGAKQANKGGTDHQINCEDMNKPEFFKVIHASLYTTEELKIPPEFFKHISNEDSEIAVLEGPSTLYDWQVRICRTQDGTYLTEGWKIFVKDNALGEYEFLVFRHQGNMFFHVEIYDKNGCKKKDKLDECTEIHQKPIASLSGGNIQGKSAEKFIGTYYRGRGRPPKNVSLSQIRGFHNGRLPTEEDKARVLKAALSFTSTFPYFTKCLNLSCVYTSYVLYIPTAFAKAHLRESKKEIVLLGRSGKSWIVTYNPSLQYSLYGRGWTCFVRDNQLNAGDVCIFELVSYMRLLVHIFPVYPTTT